MSSGVTPDATPDATPTPSGLAAPAPSTPRKGGLRPGAPDGLRARKREARLAELEAAALRLFLARGLDAVSLEDLAEAAGMSKSNLYRYFATREAVVLALLAPLRAGFEAAFGRCLAATRATPAGAPVTPVYLALALELFQTVERHRDRMTLFIQEGRGPDVGARQPMRALERELLAGAVALTEAAQARGHLRRIPPEVSAWVVFGAVERLLVAWLRDGAFASPAEVIAPLIQLVMEGIGARGDRDLASDRGPDRGGIPRADSQ
jgi:AcrR family transcriptional regulator